MAYNNILDSNNMNDSDSITYDNVTNRNEDPDPKSGGGGATTNKRPKWVDVYNGYPKDSSSNDLNAVDVFTSILGTNYDKIKFSNACATRVSLGLLNGNMNVKREFIIQKGIFKGKFFIASAINLKNWLSQKSIWGKADEIINGPTDLSNVQSIIAGRNGVYIIIGGFSGGVTGHASLWVGSKKDIISIHNYIDYGGDIYFWELI
jgi:hypothetical protein